MQEPILNPSQSLAKIRRMALEILERTAGQNPVLIAGIKSSGFGVAQLLSESLLEFSGHEWPVHSVKLNKTNPLEGPVETTVNPAELNDATLILVDDVQNSGKTMMYATRHFLQYPLASVQTCVLVDRNHNRFPVRADYVGLSLSTTLQEHVSVLVEGRSVNVFLS